MSNITNISVIKFKRCTSLDEDIKDKSESDRNAINDRGINAVIPSKATKNSAGYDLFTPYDVTVPPNNNILVKLGIKCVIPNGYYGRIAPKSGNSYKFTHTIGGGVIDNDYRNELGAIVINYGNESYTFKKGTSIAQLILEKIAENEVCIEVDNSDIDFVEKTERVGGFGSTKTGEGVGNINNV